MKVSERWRYQVVIVGCLSGRVLFSASCHRRFKQARKAYDAMCSVVKVSESAVIDVEIRDREGKRLA